MGLPQNLGRLSAALTSDASLNIGVGVTPSGSFKLEVGTTSKFTGVATFGSTLSNGTYSYTLPSATGTLALVGGAGVGTVTSVAAITLGTTGTDLSSTVANSTTTPVITLNVPTASATNRGALSAADWTTFNNKTSNTGTVTSVATAGTVSGLTLTGGTITTSGTITLGGTLSLTAANVNAVGAITNSTSGNAATATALSSGQSNWSGTGVLGNVVGLLAWKNYGNSHVIFDASQGTSPSGTSVNNTNSQIAWSALLPTLMGWNGSNTYGVRVDSARVADSATTATTATTTTGNAGSVTYLPNRGDVAAYQVLWGAPYTNGIGTVAYSCAAITIQSSTGTIFATTFSGAGTGLTGTASSLNIGGTAASETLATVTNRGNSTAQNVVFSNGRKGLIGVYDAAQTQAIFAMGAAYILTDGGASSNIGNLYGLAWSYNPDYGGAGNNPQSKAGLNHQLLHMQNGITTTAIGSGIWTIGNVTAPTFIGALTGNASTATAAQNATFLTQPNATWGGRVQLGGNGGGGAATVAVVQATNGNLHMDGGSGNAMYLNYYNNGVIYLNGGTYNISANGSQYNGNAATATTATTATTSTYSTYLNPLSGDNNYKLAYTADGARNNAGEWGRAVMYYVPNGQTYGIRVDRADYADSAGNVNSISSAVGGAYTWTGIQYFETNNGTAAVNNSNSAKLQAYSSSNNSAFMSFHKGGVYAINMGLDGDNVFRIGGWSAGPNRLQLDMSGNLTVAGSMNASRFYDSDDASYYLDANGTSVLNAVNFYGNGNFLTQLQTATACTLYMGSNSWNVYADYGGWNLLLDRNGGSAIMYMYGLYATVGSVSDIRYKKNITPVTYGLNEILQINPIKYNYDLPIGDIRHGDTDDHLGLSAQEVQSIIPEAVHIMKGKDMLAMTYLELIPVLINGIKEQQVQIEELKQSINNLTN
jgi:hypothetical protein